MFSPLFCDFVQWASLLLGQVKTQAIVVSFALLALGYFATSVIYRTCLSPLAKVPGPFLNSLTFLPLFYKTITGNYHNYILELHRRYGPVIRIGPHKISISTTADMRRVFATHNFRKDVWYKNTANPVHNTFSTSDPEFNKMRRRQLGDAYAKHTIAQMEDLVLEYGACSLKRRWNREIYEKGENGVCRINYCSSFQAFSYDVIGILGFGENFGSISNDDTRIMRWLRSGLILGGIYQFFPFTRPVAKYLFPTLFKETMKVSKCALEAAERRRALVKENKTATKNDILQRFVDAALNSKNEKTPITDMSLQSESFVLLVAGSETTSNTLTWSMMYFLHYPDVHKKAVAEVRSAFPDKSRTIRFEEARSLPYLSAVINESMRMRPVVSGAIPRVVPEGGTTIQGYFIPQGTIVNPSIMACGRDKTVWNNPDVFDPTRFLGPDGERLSRELMTFISGVRACPGRHLAMMEIYTALANILRDFDLSLLENSPYGPNRKETIGPTLLPSPVDIPGRSTFVMGPKAPQTDCWINVKRAA